MKYCASMVIDEAKRKRPADDTAPSGSGAHSSGDSTPALTTIEQVLSEDPNLTPIQRDALLAVYRSYVLLNERDEELESEEE